MKANQLTIFEAPKPTASQAVNSLIAVLAPKYSIFQIYSLSADSSFRNALISRIQRESGATRQAATHALRDSRLLP